MIQDPRQTAFNILLSWDKTSQTLDKNLLFYKNDISLLTKNDRKLCNALVFGVLRHRESIDWIIRAFSKTSLEKLDKKPLYLLRIALFQIIYMDKIPAFAAINTIVDIAKKLLGKKTAGFINAVLRISSQKHSDVALPDVKSKKAKYISVKYSLPMWLAKKWQKTFGFKKVCLLGEQINTIPKITLRANTLKIDRASLSEKLVLNVKNIEATKYASQGLSFSNPNIPIHDFDAFKLGMFQIQDEAAQLVTEFLGPKPKEKILDACAGLGGKTGHIAQMMHNQGTIMAMDLEKQKLDCLLEESKRLGIDIIRTKILDLLKSSIKDFDFYFDRVLIDAPCTGLGVLRRNPDTKWKRSQKDILRLAAQQKKMLACAANLVKPGGVIVYAVCSCEPEENEEVIEKFLNKRKDFSIDEVLKFDEVLKSDEVFKFDKDFKSDTYYKLMTNLLTPLITKDGFIKTYPRANNMDGFFAARLRRQSKKQ